ncbi:MAG: hypothetical protein J6B89_03350 [Bacilli bacterium]|nr:hypothetical protein [Bacilli bacterium]
MQIVKEILEIDEGLEKKINNLLKFNNIKARVEKGSIISLVNTNIAYIDPHKLEINGNTYLFFNKCENVYINDLSRSIPLKELEDFIKCTF